MKNLFSAYLEYINTPKEQKPFLCSDLSSGLYIVIFGFSKSFIESKGLKVVEIGKEAGNGK